MVSSFLVELSFLVSFLSVGNLILQKSQSHIVLKQHPSLFSCLFGFYGGCMGIALMAFAAHPFGAAVDFHCIAVMLTAIWGGVLPAAVCAAMQILFCFSSLGFEAAAARCAGVIFLTASASVIIARTKLSFGNQWATCTLLCIPITSINYLPFLPSNGFLYSFAVFSVSLLPASALVYEIISTELKTNELIHKLRRESSRDYLTGLNNVRRFDRMYQTALERRQNLSLLMCDIDFFKKVNDRYGHRNGDAILVQLSNVLKRDFPRGTISRNGGEEFTVLLRGHSESEALSEAERLRTDVEHASFVLLDGRKIRITVSIGAASCRCPAIGTARLFERADAALYMAKRSGRNRVAAEHAGESQPTVPIAASALETCDNIDDDLQSVARL